MTYMCCWSAAVHPCKEAEKERDLLPCFFHPDSDLSGVKASRIR